MMLRRWGRKVDRIAKNPQTEACCSHSFFLFFSPTNINTTTRHSIARMPARGEPCGIHVWVTSTCPTRKTDKKKLYNFTSKCRLSFQLTRSSYGASRRFGHQSISLFFFFLFSLPREVWMTDCNGVCQRITLRYFFWHLHLFSSKMKKRKLIED